MTKPIGIRLAACALAAALLGPAAAADAAPSAASAVGDFSAAKKKKSKQHMRAVPAPAPQVRRVWRGADPSFDEYGRLYRPPPGLDCPVDLGYGRWGSCNVDN